jgi:hypothetical protein
MYTRKWSLEKEAIFTEHVGKMSDLNLAKKLHVCVKWIAEKRRTLGIPPYYRTKYTPEHIKYINENYKTKSVREITLELTRLFPDIKFTTHGIKGYLNDHGLIRNYIDFANIRQREIEVGHHAHIVQKRVKAKNPRKPGDLYWSKSRKEICIFVGPHSTKPFRIYLWEQHNGPLPNTHHVELINKELPIVIENLRAVKKDGAPVNPSVALSDKWVTAMMLRVADPTEKNTVLNNPILIANKKLLYKAIREIKALNNENRKLAQASKANAQ